MTWTTMYVENEIHVLWNVQLLEFGCSIWKSKAKIFHIRLLYNIWGIEQ